MSHSQLQQACFPQAVGSPLLLSIGVGIGVAVPLEVNHHANEEVEDSELGSRGLVVVFSNELGCVVVAALSAVLDFVFLMLEVVLLGLVLLELALEAGALQVWFLVVIVFHCEGSVVVAALSAVLNLGLLMQEVVLLGLVLL